MDLWHREKTVGRLLMNAVPVNVKYYVTSPVSRAYQQVELNR